MGSVEKVGDLLGVLVLMFLFSCPDDVDQTGRELQVGPGKISDIAFGTVHTQFFDTANKTLYIGGYITSVERGSDGRLPLDAPPPSVNIEVT